MRKKRFASITALTLWCLLNNVPFDKYLELREEAENNDKLVDISFIEPHLIKE